ncbi:glycosyltransferase [Telluribacter sp. SYSU D00476]|uniref:glycosyltransferase n=1 Tax=Telluribacter sp. SYSU D00476 TaxID=2811430 RepID=UPI001FF0E260|nr:glycosyltransferase [Telluribacter sp. SYSU D00476]
MKVLHIFNEINYSGAEVMYKNAANKFKSLGVEMIAISTGLTKGNYSPHLEEVKIKTYHMPINFPALSWDWLKYYYVFYKFIKREDISVIHIHRNNLYFIAFIAKMAKIKCVKTQHSIFKNRWFSLPIAILKRYILRKYLNVTFHTIGKSVQENELEYYKNPNVRINNWFDGERFFPAIDKEERLLARQQLNLPKDKYLILSTGNCSDIKNHYDIIKAVAKIKDNIDFLYLHIGHGHTINSEKDLAEKLGIVDKIKFLGSCNNVRQFLIASDVFVMTSKLEGLGNAALEAQACSVPVILYDVPGLRDIVINNITGILIPPNPNDLASALNHLKNSRELSDLITYNALMYVNQEHSLKENVSKVHMLYKNII